MRVHKHIVCLVNYNLYKGRISGFHCKHSLIACFQHSNHLGPFSEEWKHVSQVKPISYIPYTISFVDILLPLLVCFCFVCLWMRADTGTRDSTDNWLQH